MPDELVEEHDPRDIRTGEKLLESPLTGNTYRMTKWVEQPDGQFIAIEKEIVERGDGLALEGVAEDDGRD